MGHSILDPYPARVPLSSADAGLTELSGISLPVRWISQADGKKLARRFRPRKKKRKKKIRLLTIVSHPAHL